MNKSKNINLDEIGFYTLSNKRAKNASLTSPLIRCELLLTDRCNLKCPYCRGVKKELQGDLPLEYAKDVLASWTYQGLENVRFSGGEPTLYPHLKALISYCKHRGIKRIAISTNGTQPLDCYKELIDLGVNDFSISLDGGCCAVSDKMTGEVKSFDKVSRNIKFLSWYNYVTVGVVFNEFNVSTARETIQYIDSLNPSDIRIISAAQYNKALEGVKNISGDILNRHPILKYRVNNFMNGRNVRGIKPSDTNKCYLVQDDIATAGAWHFPCIIYLREGGEPIGEMGRGFREQRIKWFEAHNTHRDKICRENCLDVCIDYNNKAASQGERDE